MSSIVNTYKTIIFSIATSIFTGPRPVWKDTAHPFRSDPRLKLSGIPTLVKVGEDGNLNKTDNKRLEKVGTKEEIIQIF